MEIKKIKGYTRILGEDQGYLALPIKDDFTTCAVNGDETSVMYSAWIPSKEEINNVMKGCPIILSVIGNSHPPVMISVSDKDE